MGLGALASLFALISRSSARAADALTIDSDGVAHFNGKRNFFTDEEGAGDLRVGAAWGVPGIYSQKGAVAVGSVNNNIWLNGKVGIGNDKNQPSQSLDVAGTIAADNLAASGTVTAGTVKAASLETNSGISLAAVQSAVNILIPVGTIIAYGGDTRNDTIVTTLRSQGWLPCDGRAYSAQDYPELARVIGNSFGNLRVPDLRGAFSCAAPVKAPTGTPTPAPAGRRMAATPGTMSARYKTTNSNATPTNIPSFRTMKDQTRHRVVIGFLAKIKPGPPAAMKLDPRTFTSTGSSGRSDPFRLITINCFPRRRVGR